MEHALARLLHDFTYLAVVLVLSAAGLGVPISEDLTLLLAGGLAARGITSFWPTLAAGYFGVIFGDTLIHAWGKRLGPAAYSTKRVQKALSPERQEKLRHHYAKHGFWTVVVGRHTPILRAPVFFLAGASGVPRLKFILADAVSAAITVPIVTALGFYFGEHLDEVRHKIHQAQWVLGGAVVLALAIWIWLRRFRSKAVGSAVARVPAASGPPAMYRAMMADADGLPTVARSARALGVRVPKDVLLDGAGHDHVLPGRGMSVAGDMMDLPPHRLPARFGGEGRDVLFVLSAALPDSLAAVSLPPPPTHQEICPRERSALAFYEAALASTRRGWRPV